MAVASEQVEEGSGQKAGDYSPIQQAAERAKMEWDEDLGTSRDYTELFITQGVIDFTGNL